MAETAGATMTCWLPLADSAEQFVMAVNTAAAAGCSLNAQECAARASPCGQHILQGLRLAARQAFCLRTLRNGSGSLSGAIARVVEASAYFCRVEAAGVVAGVHIALCRKSPGGIALAGSALAGIALDALSLAAVSFLVSSWCGQKATSAALAAGGHPGAAAEGRLCAAAVLIMS